MIKRLFLLLMLSLLAANAFADGRDRDMLLTSDGTFYTVETVYDPTVSGGRSAWSLMLTTQNGTSRNRAPVPATLTEGAHGNPALGYDPESGTLFLFWQQTQNGGLSSRLLFASYLNGVWSESTTLDSVDWDLRRNLKIAVTRFTDQIDEQGKRTLVPQITVHAVWWQETANGEWARYAMLTVDHGVVNDIQIRSLAGFAGVNLAETPLRSLSPHEVLRHPSVLATPSRDAVDVVFGETQSDSMFKVRLRPTLNGRLRIPIGVRDINVGRPAFEVGANATAEAITEDDRLALYTVGAKTMSFVLFRDGQWTPTRTIELNNQVAPETAVEALKKMVAAQ